MIEMQAMGALAHIRGAVLYVMDVSEQCGHTIEQQVPWSQDFSTQHVSLGMRGFLSKENQHNTS